MSWLSKAAKGIEKSVRSAVKPILVAGATAVNPALGLAAAAALTSKPRPALPALPPSVPLAPVQIDPNSAPVLMPVPGTMPTAAAPTPDVVPAMPWSQFRDIMRQSYDQGVARAFG
jgi:hypothetical protein